MSQPLPPTLRRRRAVLALIALGALALPVVGWAGATASSFKKETRLGTNYWNAQSALDGDLKTAWMVPGESPNRGEWVTLDVPKCGVDKIGMVVGFAKDDDTFDDYARVKRVQVEVFSYDENQELKALASNTVEFQDKAEMQIVDLPDVAIDDMFGGKVKISVVDIYEGKDFPNLAVSELVLHLVEFDAAPTVGDVSGEEKPRDGLVDDNAKTFWLAPSKDASITFSAPGFGISKVGLQPGPKDYDRPKKVEISANERTVVQEVPDGTTVQWIDIPPVTGYTGSAWGDIQVRVLETYPGTKSPGKLAIAELDLKATTYEGI